MPKRTEYLPVTLEDGSIIHVEVENLGGEEEAASSNTFSLQSVVSSIESVSNSFMEAINKIKPTKASIEIGFEIAVKEGALIAVLIKGESKASIKVALEWERKDKKEGE